MNRKRSHIHVLQERTNLSVQPLQYQPVTMYNFIEVTSNTPSAQLASFPTAVNTIRYVRGKEDMRIRRLARYSTSEQALAESFQHCKVQQLPQEIQLEALQKAISILNTLAADARDAVERLQALLTNRSAEPTVYKSLQRQRWMEERRHVALDQLSKTLRVELAGLSSSTTIGQTLTFEASNSKSNVNLVNFFESSRRRTPIRCVRSRARRRMPLPPRPRDEQPDDSLMEFPRRHNENHIIPLVLKPPQQRRFFPSYTPQSTKILSTPSSSVDNVTSIPSTTSDSSNLETIAEDNETVPHITLPTNSNPDEADGTVLIWRDVLRSKEEILGEFHVPMPDYVMDLLADFESNSRVGPITPPPQTRFRLDTSPPTTPRKPIQKSPSRHRLSTLFSSIPETITSRLTSTNGSDTSKASRVRLGMQPTIDSVIEGPSRPFAMAFSNVNPGNSGSQAPDTEEEKMIVRIRRRISSLGRI